MKESCIIESMGTRGKGEAISRNIENVVKKGERHFLTEDNTHPMQGKQTKGRETREINI